MIKDSTPFPTHEVQKASTTAGLPVSMALGPTAAAAHIERHSTLVDRRTLFIAALCMLIAVAASFIAMLLQGLIGFFTNLFFYGRLSFSFVSPADHSLGAWVILIPVVGGLLVGILARYGSKAIRGHGIPEAMEQILVNESRIPARITFLKPLSAAISIGTGGPFGAEGPIIATGGALGSVLGQFLRTTAVERKVLLAAGAAAGMTATFGTPLAAIFLAIELLLFEFKPRSFLPVALAAATAAACRWMLIGTAPAFQMPNVPLPSPAEIAGYAAEGVLIGIAAVAVTRLVYWIEDQFERLPIHWMWWPAVGAVAVGVIGYFAPDTLGVGYSNIDRILSGDFVGTTLIVFFLLKFLSWSISLGSGTSGGTLAPLFTVGGGLGAALGSVGHLDVRVAALVGMASMFAGASRALFASIIFAYETTRQDAALLPLLVGCVASYLVSALLMKQTIMTEKISRRGIHVPSEFSADPLEAMKVADFYASRPVHFVASGTIGEAIRLIQSGHVDFQHSGFPVLDSDGGFRGMVLRRRLLLAHQRLQEPVENFMESNQSRIELHDNLKVAVNIFIRENINLLPVFDAALNHQFVGVLSRRDVIDASKRTVREQSHATIGRDWRHPRLKPGVPGS